MWPGITVEELKALKVAGLKDSSGDCERLLDTLAQYHRPFYTGSSTIVAWAGMLVTGAILAVASLEPELCVDAFAGSVPPRRICWRRTRSSAATA